MRQNFRNEIFINMGADGSLDSTGWLCVSLIILLALSAFFSSCETAFSTVNKIRLKTLAEGGNRRARRALAIAEDYDKTLSTVLIGNNIVNIAASSIATVLFISLIDEQLAASVSTIVMTILILIFGEVTPKSYAKANAERIALLFSDPMYMLRIVFTPISRLFVHLTHFVTKTSGQDDAPSVTEEELRYIIDTTAEEGVLLESESELLHSAMEFDDIKVHEILTPRVDIVAINVEDDIPTVLEFVLSERYSRIPVYEESIDHIIGVLHTRDFLEELATGKTPDLRRLLSECLYVHRNLKISTLLSDFKRTKNNMAVVMDDYGGTMGIVTTEDILEELVGEIWDEDEEIVHEFNALGDGTYEIAGEYPIRDLLDEFDLDEDDLDAESNSVGGWAMEEFGRIPDVGDSFTWRNLEVTVLEIDDQRIVKLLVKVHAAEEEAEEKD